MLTRHLAFVLLPLAAACSSPSFVARRTVELELPLDDTSTVQCTSHNGGIRVENGNDVANVRVLAELQVRGYSQAEAEDNLASMAVRHDRDGGVLHVYGEHPKELNWRYSPSYAFDLTVPEQVSLQLVTHNGDVRAAGTSGSVAIETHNGSVEAQVVRPGFSIETHNGRVELAIREGGPLGGTVLTHNGSVEVSLPPGANGWLEASTHNGSIRAPEGLADTDDSRRRLRARIGDEDGGTLKVETHNGSVRIR
ncbi:MAG: DUF4097 family beta strand repeat protein [Planctomycetes bacterium]|nr:DUF4097 family beta strand repeat protein [Planctomycetota bacterium]